MTYLEQHPPARPQYTRPRRSDPSGAIVVHTAENVPDLDGLDGGAEGVAAYIARRSDAGSYHTLVDADSIVRVVPFDAEAYGEGTGGNRWALHLSFACRTTTWDQMGPDRRLAMLHNGARAAADMARWLVANGHRPPGAVRMTADDYRRKAPGFISHAELDPRRRSDPGPAFPWGNFLDLYAREINMPTTPPAATSSTERALIGQWQGMLLDNGAGLGDSGPAGNGRDEQFGRLTLEASKVVLDHRNQLLGQVERLGRELSAMEALAATRGEQLAAVHVLAQGRADIIVDLEQQLAAAREASGSLDRERALQAIHEAERALGGDGQ